MKKMRVFFLLTTMIYCWSCVFGQKIVGTVYDSKTRETIAGANIVFVSDPTHGGITNHNGAFSIEAPQGAALIASFIGYKDFKFTVTAEQVYNILLEEDNTLLDDIVVIGYGTIKKKDLTGAVSSVKSDAIMRQPVANVAEALQGQAPGVLITSNSGAPGGSINVRIRGVGTVNNSDPLYVVDGVPVSNIDYLGTSDIQSIDILKDASATAIYGARGANGVVLVTTKKGETGKTIVNLESYFGVNQILNNLNLLSGPEWYDLQTEINKLRAAPIDLSKINRNTSTNWMDEITRSAAIQSYSVNVSGGAKDEYIYNVGVNYVNREGTIKKTDYERISLRESIEKTVIKNILNLGTNLTISQSNQNNILEGSNTVGIINSAIKLEPVIPVKDANGAYGWSPYIDYNNPVADIDFTTNKTKIASLVGNVYATLKILEDFTFKSSYGIDRRNADIYTFNPVYEVSSYQKNSINKVTRSYTKFEFNVLENTLSYNTAIDKHSVNALVGYTREWSRTETLKGEKNNTPTDDPNMQYLDAAQDASSAVASGDAVESALISYLGRVNYNYDDRYLATASIRRDGSSRFGSNNKYGNFPSFALGWKLSNESFMKDNTLGWLTSFKLRGGWGRIGNQNIDNYMYQNLLSSNIQYSYLFGDGSNEKLYQGVVAVKMGNKDVKWETTESTNIGLDFTLFDGRFDFSGEYYLKKTKDMLLTEPIPYYLGFETGPITNIGSAENKGFELIVNWKDEIGSFAYNVGFNFTTINNEMTSIGGTGSPITGGNIRNGNATITRIGEPIGSFYGYKTDGLIQTEDQLAKVKKLQPNAELGDVVFVNTNNDASLNDDDKVTLGSPIPDIIYGINLGASWKGVDLNLQFGGTYGNEIFNAMRYFTYSLADVTNKDKVVLNYWRPGNTNTDIPRLINKDSNDNMRISDRYVEDGSYLRLRNVQLGYTLPVSLTNKFYIERLRLYVTGQNLFTITNYSGSDPEVGQITSTNYLSRGVDIGTYPQAKSIIGGVSITF